MFATLILIDIQNDYFPGGRMELEGAVEAGRAAGGLLAFFREHRWPVIHVQHESVQPGASFFLPGSPGMEIHASVAPRLGEPVVVKHFPNSFRATTLPGLLEGRVSRRLVLAGMMTHMCVDATTRAAADFGWECVVAQDACATRRLTLGERTAAAADVQTAFLAALNGFYARVMPAEAVKALLAQG